LRRKSCECTTCGGAVKKLPIADLNSKIIDDFVVQSSLKQKLLTAMNKGYI
jgi:hypothetical protein